VVVVIGHDRHDLERTADPLPGGALGRFASALTPAPTDAAPQPTSGHSWRRGVDSDRQPAGRRRIPAPSFAPRASLRGRRGALVKYAWNTR